MHKPTLFLGYPVTDQFSDAFLSLPEEKRRLFISSDDHYLQEVEHNGCAYLGKNLGSEVKMRKILLLEENIYTLLQSLTPNFNVKNKPLMLFPL